MAGHKAVAKRDTLDEAKQYAMDNPANRIIQTDNQFLPAKIHGAWCLAANYEYGVNEHWVQCDVTWLCQQIVSDVLYEGFSLCVQPKPSPVVI